MRQPMTPGNARVYWAVLRLIEDGRRPTVRAICQETGQVLSTTHWHLRKLRRDGRLTWEDGRSGTIAPTQRITYVALVTTP